MIQIKIIILFFALLNYVKLKSIFNQKFQYDYLKHYGYINENKKNDIQSMEEGIKKFQRFFKLEVDGKFNEETKNLMVKPRCSIPDITLGKYINVNMFNFTLDEDEVSIVYFHQRWTKINLTWDIKEIDGYDIDHIKMDQIIKITDDAFKWWENISVLKFRRDNTTKPDFQLLISHSDKKGIHKDNFYSNENCLSEFNIEGSLAHANFPYYNRSTTLHIRYEYLKDWDLYKSYDSNCYDNIYFNVIIHEIGHSLGLQHTSNKESVMFPFLGMENGCTNKDLEKAILNYYYGKSYKNLDVDFKINKISNTGYLKVTPIQILNNNISTEVQTDNPNDTNKFVITNPNEPKKIITNKKKNMVIITMNCVLLI